MSECRPHQVRLTDDQLEAVKHLFDERGWELDVQTDELYKLRKEAADDYVDLVNNGHTTLSREQDKDSPIQLRPRAVTKPGQNGSTYTLDKNQKDLELMKELGSSFKKSIRSRPKVSNVTERSPCKQTWRMSTMPEVCEEESIESDVSFTHFVLPTENTIKILTKLSTTHVQNVSRVPVRIVLLVDRSGSMLHKLGRDGRHAKITKVRHFVEKLIQSLDDGDEVALVTFGEDADILFPLVKLNQRSREKLTGDVRSLDRGSMAQVTNLSIGLRKALKVFYDATKNKPDYLLSTKNSILVFTDGDINGGTQNTNELIHEVRQNIRNMVPSLDHTQSQWVTISVVNTGTSVSEQAFTLSKTCSSDAYYYIDSAAEDPEAELFLPVLLRKTAVAWNISYVIEAFHDIKFIDNKCSRDNLIRMRRSLSGRNQQEEKSYFLYDFPAGKTREFGVYASWRGKEHIDGLDDEEVIFKMKVEFTNIKGERYWQVVTVSKGEIMKAMEQSDEPEASTAVLKHEMKLVTGEALRTAADLLKTGDKRASKAVILEGQIDLQKLLNAFGEKSQEDEAESEHRDNKVHEYAKCVVDNMKSLLDTIETGSQGAAWNKVKAVSTAIDRETPNTTETLVDGDILCPFPAIGHMETGALRDPLQRIQAKNTRTDKRITFGNLDTLLENQLS